MGKHTIKKCLNTGNWVQMCPALKNVTSKNIAYFSELVLHNGTFDTQRLMIFVGDDVCGRVQLDYCPFCGTNIETKHKVGGQDEYDYSI
ncbi:hypothetical protein [Acinetobacter thermotolerans]|uniref:hypothetical protein n=1 Tax=Acinetobacter thermotolerans TaxID=3151487 RepID=UPI00325B6D87